MKKPIYAEHDLLESKNCGLEMNSKSFNPHVQAFVFCRTHVANLIAHRWSDPLSVYTQCQWQFACNTYCKLFASTPIVHTITQSGLFTRNPNKYSDCIGNSLFSLPDRWNSGRQLIGTIQPFRVHSPYILCSSHSLSCSITCNGYASTHPIS